MFRFLFHKLCRPCYQVFYFGQAFCLARTTNSATLGTRWCNGNIIILPQGSTWWLLRCPELVEGSLPKGACRSVVSRWSVLFVGKIHLTPNLLV